MVRPPHVRRRRRIVESYQARWHGRCYSQEKLCVRVDRYRLSRCDIAAHVLQQDEEGDWQQPNQDEAQFRGSGRRLLTHRGLS